MAKKQPSSNHRVGVQNPATSAPEDARPNKRPATMPGSNGDAGGNMTGPRKNGPQGSNV